MTALRVVLGDQLSRSLTSLRDCADGDVVLMVEVADEATYVRHHKRKIAFLFSAMRHFADELRKDGVTVDYVALDDPDNEGSFDGEVKRALTRHDVDRIVVTEAGEYRVQQMLEGWERSFKVPVEIRADDRFLCSHATFAAWAEDRKTLRMEFFYREMRDQTGYLMVGKGDPVGGQWNFDSDNRKPLPKRITVPEHPRINTNVRDS